MEIPLRKIVPARAALSRFKSTMPPSLRLAFDFLAVLAVSIILLWLAVVMPVAALA